MLARAERLATDSRAAAGATLAGALAGCVVLAVVDPNEPGHYPTCPTRALLGIDCPACGTLRGVHALLHGRVLDVLDHNLLLLVAVPLAVAFLALRTAPLIGRPARWITLSPRVLTVVIVVAVAFTVLRNLPFSPFEGLSSSAS